MYAQNLLHGFYSPHNEVYLWNGPGYPLVLVPFLALGIPLIYATLLNAVFQYIAVVYLFKALQLFVGKKTAIIFSLFWACFYIAFKEMTWLYTECLANMLICIFLYYSAAIYFSVKNEPEKIIISGCLFGYLTLTKVVFGYVLLFLLIILLCAYLFRRTTSIKKSLMIMVIALVTNIPYLAYTWQLTGKVFYWANSGGMSLYWASTPFEEEFGDWNDDHFTAYCGYDENIACNAALFARNHQRDYDSIYQYTGIARDDAFRKKAISNIKRYPLKYVKNCFANAGRLFFGIPFSYNYHRFQNVLRIPPGAIVLLMFLFSLLISLMNLNRLPFVILFFAGILIAYLGATLLVSITQRMLSVAVPLIVLWTAYIFDKTINFRKRIE